MAISDIVEAYKLYYQTLLTADPYSETRVKFALDEDDVPINLKATYSEEMRNLLASFNSPLMPQQRPVDHITFDEVLKICINNMLNMEEDRRPFLLSPDGKPIMSLVDLKEVWKHQELGANIGDWEFYNEGWRDFYQSEFDIFQGSMELILIKSPDSPEWGSRRHIILDIGNLPKEFLQDPCWFKREAPHDSFDERLMNYVLEIIGGRLTSLKRHFSRLQTYFAPRHYRNLRVLKSKATGKGATALVSKAEETNNTFHKKGDFWDFAFEGESGHLKDILGWKYIDVLLHSGHGREFTVLELIGEVEKRTASGTGIYSKMSKEELGKEGLSISKLDDSGNKIDEDTKKECERRLKELEDKIEVARTCGKEEEAEKLDEEKKKVTSYLSSAVGLHGRIRKNDSEVEAARSAVTKNILRARNSVKEDYPAFYQHLKTSIDTGKTVSYTPKEPTYWD
ncbi:MAG: hypothetical protein ACYSTI_10865 [Planctomycetota bacterium]|jgi:hypothetical protein